LRQQVIEHALDECTLDATVGRLFPNFGVRFSGDVFGRYDAGGRARDNWDRYDRLSNEHWRSEEMANA
jgi:hypothetical protein